MSYTNLGIDAVAGATTHANLSAFHDTNPLPFIARAVYCGEAGALALKCAADGSVATYLVAAGTILTGFFSHVMATGTTVTTPGNIVILG